MAKTITVKDNKNSQTYLLEYTRETAARIEDMGFKASEAVDKANVNLPLLFAGAFLAHHETVSQGTVERLLKEIPNKKKLWGVLVSMYNETVMALMKEPDEADKGNVDWAEG